MTTGNLDVVGDLLAADRCALLVIDKQRWYLDAAVSPFLTDADTEVVDREVAEHDRFIGEARRAHVPIIWTVMTEGDEHAPANILARWARRPTEPRLRRTDTGFEYAGDGPEPDDAVFEKVYPDAFSVAALAEHIAALGRSTVVIIGGYAARCVLATAFGAQSRGFDVVVPMGLAEPHPRHEHEEKVFLAVIDSVVGCAVVPEELLGHWRRPEAAGRSC